MNFVLISAPGSGKGTFSQYMIEKHDYVQICPGDLFRKEIALSTKLGKRIQPIVDRGDYVDEIIVCQIVEKYICEAIEQKKGFILDGFPRSEISFNFLHSLLRDKNLENKVCFLQFIASDEICANRIVHRAVCMCCFRVYNTVSNQPVCDNTCDNCECKLSLRKADTLDVVYKRLNYFHNYIEPVMGIAHQHYPTVKINSDNPLDSLEKQYEKLLA